MSNKNVMMLGGVFAGIINGFLGTGGGILLWFLLEKIYKGNKAKNQKQEKQKYDDYDEYDEYDEKDAFASVLPVTCALSVISVVMYIIKGKINFSFDNLIYLPSAIVGGICGAYLLNKIKVEWLKHIFSFLVIYAGLSMAGVI